MPILVVINTDQAPLDGVLLRSVMGPQVGGGRGEVLIDESVGLGSTDLGGVAQSRLRTGEGPVYAIFDGRLDDRERLVASLGDCGTSLPATIPDAALLLCAYEKWAEECVSHLVGDFAFCLWASRNRRLMCGRDHFGVKPLYYAQVGNALIVSSSLRWMRRHPAVSRRLHNEAIGDFLLFGACVTPAQTAFADISRVPPAHCLSYSSTVSRPRITRYWQLSSAETVRHADPRDYVEQFAGRLRIAVADRLRGAPVSVLMSGGLDSSSVAAAALDVVGQAARDRVRAFTIVYNGMANEEERHYSTVVARSLGIEISHMAADNYEPFERWDVGGVPPEPTLEALSAIMLDVLDVASRHGNAVLTGDGGDLILLPDSVLDQIGNVTWPSLATGLIRSLSRQLRPPLGLRSRFLRWRGRSAVPTWLSGQLLEHFDPRARSREVQSMRSGCSGARSTAFGEVTDPWWTSMFESLDPGATERSVEVRYPFFDVRLATYALRLPSFPWCLDKHVLREATRGALPPAVRTRPKTPLAGSPIARADQWSPRRALELFDRTPGMAAFVDTRKFRATVHGDSLLSNESLSAWAAISLATWMRCDSAAAALTKTG
jgi:asparagine synthase (glutamine-hydrolysing)